jgi:probable HAF family extracellular repeat protein
MKTRRYLFPAVAAGLAGLITTAPTASASVAAPGFYPLGVVDSAHTYSFGTALSSDGRVVGGESGISSFSPQNSGAATWSGTNWSVKTPYPSASTFEPYGILQGLNDSGDVGAGIVAQQTGASTKINVPARWTSAGGLVALSSFSGQGHAVSATGAVVVGQMSGSSANSVDAFRWTQAGGMQLLPTVNGTVAAGNINVAYAVSADGNVIAGRSRNATNAVGFAWTPTLGSVELAQLPSATGTAARSIGWGISGDGAIIVGEARDSNGARNAVRWSFNATTGASTVTSLGDLPGGAGAALPNGAARSVSDDGSVIVGDSESGNGTEAFLWRSGIGMVSLRDFLINEMGYSSLVNWTLSSANEVSADGTVITGWGTTGGVTQAYVVVIPEPSIVGIGGVVVVAGLLRRRQRRRMA